jgi:ParB family chromosome partitioning protein
VANPRKKGLGRGLGALIGQGGADAAKAVTPPKAAPKPAPKETPKAAAQVAVPAAPKFPEALPDGSRLVLIDPRTIAPNPQQPRHTFNEERLQELAESIRQEGVQSPIEVRENADGYELVSGERRVKASILAEVDSIPAVCRPISDRDMLKRALIENIQREDLNAIETALGYQGIIKEFHWTQEELAEHIGKNRATITNTLRLLNLPSDVQQRVQEGQLTMGHARALLAFDSPAKQSAVCRAIIRDGLSVRQVEKLAAPKDPKSPTDSKPKDAHVSKIEDDLRRRFGTRVSLKSNSENRGKIEIEFFNLDDLERILDMLNS